MIASHVCRTAILGCVLTSVCLLGACDGDPADLASAPRYVWVDSGVPALTPRERSAEVASAGYAFAMRAPGREAKAETVLLFTDSTMQDTIGLIGGAWLSAQTPGGKPVHPTSGLSRVVLRLHPKEVKRDSVAAAAAVRQTRRENPITRSGYAACLTEETFDQFVTAIAQNDKRGAEYLIGRSCIMLAPGLAVSVLDRTWSGRVKIRVYADQEAVELYTYSEAIDDGRPDAD